MKSTTPRGGRRSKPAPEASPEYVLEEQAGHLLRRAHQRHTALFMEHIGPHALTPTQWAALYKLRELGSVSQNQLGRLTAVDAATMQGLIQRLILRGLVTQKQDPSDRRRNALRLTAEGKAVVTACLPNAARITRKTLAPYTREEREVFLKLLQRLT